ncbi:12937_t:CDS:2, partial [Acaulospora morrowiae]
LKECLFRIILCKDSEQRRMFKDCSVSMLAAYLQLISNLSMVVYSHNMLVTLGMDNSYKVVLAQGIIWFGTKKAYLLVWNKEGRSKYEGILIQELRFKDSEQRRIFKA